MNSRKNTLFVGLALGFITFLAAAGCRAQTPPPPAAATEGKPPGTSVASGVWEIGRVSHPRLTECSGIISSRQYPGVFWVHNDGGGPKRQILYAISRTGEDRAEFRLSDVLVEDWEDIAIDDAKHIYIGDIGNNDAKRTEIAVHRIDEPNPAAVRGVVRIQKTWRLRYPAARFDAESLFIWKDYGYIVSKVFKDARAEIYRFPLADAAQPVTLEFVAQTKIESPVTGADISSDGKLLALVAKSGAFVIQINGNVAKANKEKGYQTKYRHEHIEGCTFVPEGLLCTAESREIYLFNDPPFRGD